MVGIFWILIGVTVLGLLLFLGFLTLLARQVPDDSERSGETRLNPDLLRVVAYILVILICLVATMLEIRAIYSN